MKVKSIATLGLVLVVVGGGLFVARNKKSIDVGSNATETVVESTQTPTQSTSPTAVAIINTELALTITSPKNGATVKNSSVTVVGKTAPLAEVFVNDEQTVADAKGNFSVKLTIDEGENPIIVSVNDADGRIAEKELIVNYEME